MRAKKFETNRQLRRVISMPSRSASGAVHNDSGADEKPGRQGLSAPSCCFSVVGRGGKAKFTFLLPFLFTFCLQPQWPDLHSAAMPRLSGASCQKSSTRAAPVEAAPGMVCDQK
jgi:hypothetical protein